MAVDLRNSIVVIKNASAFEALVEICKLCGIESVKEALREIETENKEFPIPIVSLYDGNQSEPK